MNSVTPIAVALDDGNDQYKLLVNGQSHKFHTHIERGSARIASNDGQADTKICHYISASGVEYSIGEVDNPMERNDEFPFTEASNMLLNHAFNIGGLGHGEKIVLCTSLPLRQFYKSNGELNKENIERKVNNVKMFSQHRSLDNTPVLLVNLVQPEAVVAVSALYYKEVDGVVVIDDRYKFKTIAVVDPGGKTTDIAVIRDQRIIMDRSATRKLGMNDLYFRARRYLEDLGFSHISENQVRLLLNEGRIIVKGKSEDHSEYSEKLKESLALDIADEVISRLGTAKDIDFIYLIGGAVKALQDYLLPLLIKHFGEDQLLISDNPEFANVDGMLIFTKLFIQRKFSS